MRTHKCTACNTHKYAPAYLCIRAANAPCTLADQHTHNADVARTLRGHKITAGLLPLDCRLLPLKETVLKV